MNFTWPAEYINFKEEVIQFAKDELNDQISMRDQTEVFPKDLWKSCALFGIQGLSVPKKYGGKDDEVNFLKSMLAMEGLGFGSRDNGLPFGLNAQMWTVQTPLVEFGTEAQKLKYLPGMCEGNLIGAHALTEPDAGSDVFSMKLKATKVEGGFLLNGKKHLITFAPICDFAIVFANVNPDLGKWGITAFIVDKGSPGFNSSIKKGKMGMRCIPIGDLIFQDCFVPEENILGSTGMGFSILNYSLEYDRCCILASQLGAMERQLEQAVNYAKERQQFGQSISKFQSVSNRLVEMKLKIETSRLLLYKTAWLKDQGKSAMVEAALLKLHLSESFLESSIDLMRTFGGISYLSENEIEREVRDAMGSVLYAGTSDIQRNIVASLMGL